MNAPEGEGRAAPHDTLWQRAPGWRNLVVTATFFTAAALAMPLLAPQEEAVPAAPVRAISAAPANQASAPVAATSIVAPPPARQERSVAAAPSAPVTQVPAPQAPRPQPLASLPLPPAAPQPQTQAQPAPAENAQACSISLPYEARAMGTGIVVRFEAPARAQQRMRNNQLAVGGPINPIFALAPRMVVRMDGASPGAPDQIVVLPPGMSARIGDRISFNSIHRDPDAACAFIPPLLTTNAGPAAGETAARPPAPVNP
jgi:hypothetical protein